MSRFMDWQVGANLLTGLEEPSNVCHVVFFMKNSSWVAAQGLTWRKLTGGSTMPPNRCSVGSINLFVDCLCITADTVNFDF